MVCILINLTLNDKLYDVYFSLPTLSTKWYIMKKKKRKTIEHQTEIYYYCP